MGKELIKQLRWWAAECDRTNFGCQARKLLIEAADELEKTEPKRGRWKYYHKQGIAVCANCSFERNVDDNFGRAIACPNCGADMRERKGDDER